MPSRSPKKQKQKQKRKRPKNVDLEDLQFFALQKEQEVAHRIAKKPKVAQAIERGSNRLGQALKPNSTKANKSVKDLLEVLERHEQDEEMGKGDDGGNHDERSAESDAASNASEENSVEEELEDGEAFKEMDFEEENAFHGRHSTEECVTFAEVAGKKDSATVLSVPGFADFRSSLEPPEDLTRILAQVAGKHNRNLFDVAPNKVNKAVRWRWRNRRQTLAENALAAADCASQTEEQQQKIPLTFRQQQAQQWKRYTRTPDAKTLFSLLNNFVDVEYCHQDHTKGYGVRALYMLHVANHVYAARQRVWRNGAEISEMAEMSHGDPKREDMGCTEESENRWRDQGLTRPRVLLLAPFRSVAVELIEHLWHALPSAKQVVMKKKFVSEYDLPSDETNRHADLRMRQKKPPDFYHLFRGNSDDCFAVGVQVRKTTLRLMAQLDESDVIVASPLGLKLALEPEGKGYDASELGRKAEGDSQDDDGEGGSGDECHTALDESHVEGGGTADTYGRNKAAPSNAAFLSSIEILVVDRADVMKMQNWQHLVDMISVVNNLPKEVTVDIRRIRPAYAAGLARVLRQTILLSDGRHADVAAVGREHCRNIRGSVRLWRPSEADVIGAIQQRGIRQIFQCVPTKGRMSMHKDFIDYFRIKIFPNLIASLRNVAIVVPTYVEFLSLRRAFNELRTPFASWHEYSSKSMVAKSLNSVRDGDINFLVVTERYLFFRRTKLASCCQHVVFLPVPQSPQIYNECIEACENSLALRERHLCIVVACYSRFHANEVERLVRLPRALHLIDAAESSTATSGKLFSFGAVEPAVGIATKNNDSL